MIDWEVNYMKWSEEEIKLIKENYLTMNDEEMSIKLFNGKRSKKSIEKKRLSLGLKTRVKPLEWSEEEIKILIETFPFYTTKEIKIYFLPHREERYINERANKLGLKKNEETIEKTRIQKGNILSQKLKGRQFSEEHKRNLSQTRKKLFSEGKLVSLWKGRVVSEEEKAKSRERVLGKWGGDKNPRHLNPLYGKENGNWKGGITNLSQALRENIYEWKKQSMEHCNYKCLFSGQCFSDIHHITPFNSMIKECMCELNYEIKENLSLYNEEEKNSIINLIKEKHNVFGICLCGEIHKLFHDLYSYKSFDIENLIEFANDYFEEKYDHLLSEEYKSKNSNNKKEYVLDKIINSKISITR